MRQLVHDVFRNADGVPPMTDHDDPNPPETGPDPETKAFFDLLRDVMNHCGKGVNCQNFLSLYFCST